MKKLALIPLATLAVSCTAGASGAPEEMSATAQTRLAEELRGYTAGPTLSCVSQRDLRGNRSVGEEAIIFEGRGRTIYVNRPPAGCPELSFNRALITRTPSTRLCRGDIATVFDPTSSIEYGSCGLGDFTEYRKMPR
jgi:hypothetical protein